ncbi:MAG: hypothetical protein FJY73_06745 [Candidatus Eisenbacteria bacterium]|nr:hypothetical protein [Candidatus Eisenbacteria bacterium]
MKFNVPTVTMTWGEIKSLWQEGQNGCGNGGNTTPPSSGGSNPPNP